MKIIVAIIPLFILFTLDGSAQSRKDKKLLSTSFLDKDSVIIQISYSEIPNCVESYYGALIIVKNKNEVFVKHKKPKSHKWNTKNIISDSTILYVQSFERIAKEGETICGGHLGGNGVEATLRINGNETELVYCKDEWDGIEELLSKLESTE